jgi:hypothetical protein
MMTQKTFAFAFPSAVLILGTIVSAQRQTLHDAVREIPVGGSVEVSILGATPTRPLRALVSEADLAIVGIVDRSMSLLTRDETSVETTLDLSVTRVLYRNVASLPLPSGAVINRLWVIEPGGEADVDGRAVIVRDNGSPPLEVGPTYVLILKKREGAPEGTFRVVTSGAWEVRDRQVFAQRPLWLTDAHAHDGKDVDEFVTALQSVWPKQVSK